MYSSFSALTPSDNVVPNLVCEACIILTRRNSYQRKGYGLHLDVEFSGRPGTMYITTEQLIIITDLPLVSVLIVRNTLIGCAVQYNLEVTRLAELLQAPLGPPSVQPSDNVGKNKYLWLYES